MHTIQSLLCASGLGILAIAFSAVTAATEPAELAREARCNVCHDAVEQRLGPSWSAIANRYGDDPQAVDTLRASMRAGSSGVWGKPPMPPVTDEQLSEDSLTAVINWVLDR